MDSEGLRLGMFLGGLIMASVPVSLGLGVGIYVLRRYFADRETDDGERSGSHERA